MSARDIRRRAASAAILTVAVCVGVGALTAGDVDSDHIDRDTPGGHHAVPIPDDFTVRARIVAIVPEVPSRLAWRHGGEGARGDRVAGHFLAVRSDGSSENPEDVETRSARSDDRLAVGEWSQPIAVRDFGSEPGRRLVLTITAGSKGRRVSVAPLVFEGFSTGIEAEFDVRYRGRPIKTVRVRSTEGQVFGIVIPLHLLSEGVTPDDSEFARQLTGLIEYEIDRRRPLLNVPWASWPRPEEFLIIDNIRGYRPFNYHGTRFSSRALVMEMVATLRLLGVNGLRSPPAFLLDDIERRRGIAAEMSRGTITRGMGYPVPSAKHLRPNQTVPIGAGCPFGPSVEEQTSTAVAESLRRALGFRVDEVWALTVDEIGTVIDRAPEGKGHLAVCPRCQRAFRSWLSSLGLKPADFERASWNQISPLDVWDREGPRPWLSDRGDALMAYYTRRFNCYASAQLFTPLRDACRRENQSKRAALADPTLRDSETARQPWLYSYALRGCTFLYGGHSLDFFNFYRNADNAFVYETSNRDPRVWSWDSYLCDVGRVVSAENDLEQGIYVKPHRGAVVQRALTAVSRGASMLYWYNFGPEYAKGDSYSQRPETLALTSQAAALIGRTEDVLYGAEWLVPAEVGLVSPRSSEIWAGLGALPTGAAAHENAKWSYTALAHAHIPVDPLDEQMLAHGDLSPYRVLYVLGPHLRRDASVKVAEWVHDGGVLYTSGYGLARDEGNEPLREMLPMLGLTERGEPQMWTDVKAYRSTELQDFGKKRSKIAEPAEGTAMSPGGHDGVAFQPIVGREVLHPRPGVEVLARFEDGGAAVVRHPYGRGVVYVVGLWPGLEYSATVRRKDFDMTTDFDEDLRALIVDPALRAGVTPVVDVSMPTVEGVLLENPRTGRRAVVLMNWAYRIVELQKRQVTVRGKPRESVRYIRGHVPATNVRIRVWGAGPVTTVRSVMSGTTLRPSRRGEEVAVTLPVLAEGDVLLLE